MPMIRHWVDAFGRRNPVYEDEEVAARTRFRGLIAPPAMLQNLDHAAPGARGIGERSGAPQEMDPASPLALLDRVGFNACWATNSELEFDRPLREGDWLRSEVIVESVSPRKKTGLGQGYFLTWTQEYVDQNGASVGRSASAC